MLDQHQDNNLPVQKNSENEHTVHRSSPPHTPGPRRPCRSDPTPLGPPFHTPVCICRNGNIGMPAARCRDRLQSSMPTVAAIPYSVAEAISRASGPPPPFVQTGRDLCAPQWLKPRRRTSAPAPRTCFATAVSARRDHPRALLSRCARRDRRASASYSDSDSVRSSPLARPAPLVATRDCSTPENLSVDLWYRAQMCSKRYPDEYRLFMM